MNSCAIQQNAFAACEEARGPLVCPKPRRIRPDITAEVDLLDIFLSKGEENLVDSPFFCGSPPSRSANPIVNDSRFGELVPLNDPLPVPAPVPVLTRAGCAWAKFGLREPWHPGRCLAIFNRIY
ncbi:uncharacterized protein A4U43_C01F32540 [Asparagus officinalis]|uniref:Uncharacterized protein n=1 Tax=Asparagus officinalis TaxID=4686 RepID=A0A5P1FUU7_ASPOF|nr:uncharacterized protein A4U43_C01F32540 [Asparagus officinalis]